MPQGGSSEAAMLLGIAGHAVFRSEAPLAFRALFDATGRRGAYLRLAARDAREAMGLFHGLHLDGMDLGPDLREGVPSLLDGYEADAPAGAPVDFIRRADDGRMLGGRLEGLRACVMPGNDVVPFQRALGSWERFTGAAVPGPVVERATRAWTSAMARRSGRRPGLALVGLMGSGKSGAGPVLAELLGLPFADSDLVVEAEAGMPVARIFALEGEAGFRARETRALERITRGPPCVLAAGGGLPIEAANRPFLAASFETVWLVVSPEVAARRVGQGGRPLLEGRDALAVLRSLEEARRLGYASVADLVVGAETEGPHATAVRIHDEMR